ncbi:hypothetical protein S7711_06735 [Stachybotrys chartarum IBT 7711]|uniref:Ubiquitination network signaling protein n=1 Tax=Stachybotrys chartarum (strain CBS 109288 / IBT 7711) TaxID=1280523 RepID=A0A084B5S6_STACB|nr:hypothetical protein S7711_06735 [Stachybotrys chartarum IBT 7711]
MPRASGSSKRQQGGAAGGRESRHDHGLVGPTRRVTGRKSQSQLDASAAAAAAAGRPADNAAAQPFPSHAAPNGFSKHHTDPLPDGRSGDGPRRTSVGAASETSSESSASHAGANGLSLDGVHRQIDINAVKNADVHRDPGPFELAMTVLKSLPMQDTLAILIILMHVPSLSLSVIYTIFTLLTFVPPVTTSSGMNINLAEIFDGNSTMPSLVTVVCMDFFFLLVWLFLWQPMQDILLDFAKPVVAITLGGGTKRDGTSRGVTTCFTWVLLHHLVRATRHHWTHLVRHIPDQWRLPAILHESFDFTWNMYDKRNANGWLRSALAIHILTQGMVRYIREWYLKREKANATAGLSDPEAGKGPVTVEGSNDTFNAIDEAWLQPSQPSIKKRRKQSAQVRLQQPLWAALASTKIVVVKEYELSHASQETAGSNATDIHNLGNAPFDTQLGQIWLSYIGPDELCFATSPFPERDEATMTSSGHPSRPAGVDVTKPFYVRINDAYWQPTRLFPVDDAEDSCPAGTRWTGEIYGLRPMSKYVVEFVDMDTEEILLSSTIRTAKPRQDLDDGSSPAVADDQQLLRPDSPATTLKTSIEAAEAKLSDEKNRLKTARKEWKTRVNNFKKDNETTDNQLASSGNHDEKYKQKIRQQETQKSQAERDTGGLGQQLKNFDAAPEQLDRKKKMERAYTAEKKIFDAGAKQHKEHKTRLDNEVKAKELEKSNLNTRRNKIATRIAKVENELANITDANNRGLDEAERRNQERAVWQDHTAGIEGNYYERLAHVRAANAARTEHIKNAQIQLQAFHEYLNSANGMPFDVNGGPDAGMYQPQQSTWNPNPAAAPHFPAGLWSTSIDTQSMPAMAEPLNMPAWLPPPTAPAFEPRGVRSRGRSSSMLSNISGFTQSSEEGGSLGGGVQQTRPLWARNARLNGSHGSSGSRSSGHSLSPEPGL